MKVKEVANLVGISVRTLHHYDEIGLLKPDQMNEAGYRIYSQENLDRLQQILFFKELGFSLKRMKEIMNNPTYNQLEALETQYAFLLEKQQKLNKMIQTMEKTIKHKKENKKMTNKEKFKGFDFSKNPYEQEARERWGDQAVNEANKKINGIEANEYEQQFNNIYFNLATLRHLDPASDKAQVGIKQWYTFLNQIGNYSLEAFRGLGQMYVMDERFTKNIDQFGEGLAQFMCEAMDVFAGKNKK